MHAPRIRKLIEKTMPDLLPGSINNNLSRASNRSFKILLDQPTCFRHLSFFSNHGYHLAEKKVSVAKHINLPLSKWTVFLTPLIYPRHLSLTPLIYPKVSLFSNRNLSFKQDPSKVDKIKNHHFHRLK